MNDAATVADTQETPVTAGGGFLLSHLKSLEAESIHVIREVAAEFENPVMLYSIGKDSSVMVRLAQKAFHPGKIPFPLLHVDTGFKFQAMYKFREELTKSIGAELRVYRNEAAIASQTNPFDLGTQKCCALLKTQGLLDGLRQGGYDAAFGGARRDEEKSRAKERILSFRDQFGQWDPKNQRPELWDIFNTRIDKGETIRAFPISNWTETDVWHYIHLESIPIVPLYFAANRRMVERHDQLIPLDGPIPLVAGETPIDVMCRFRTLGCYPCTGAVRSTAVSVKEIIEELLVERTSERITRIIDHDVEGSMEDKKREGYF